jgi:oleandomycin transport system permease protein
MSAVALAPAGRPNVIANTLTIARRNLLHIKANPELLVEMSIQPIMFLVLFVYVFGGAIAESSREYLQFALPGILVQAIAFTPFATALGLNVDFQRGLIDRFRSLPMSRSAVIGGRITADSVRITWSVLLMTAVGVALGFRFQNGVAGAIGAFAVVIAFGLSLCWPMAFVGIVSRTTESVNTLGFMIILPLTFASSAFVPVETMPGWLQAFAEINPVTQVIDAVRGLMLGGPVAEPVLASVAWMAGIVLVFAPLAILRYRRRT